MNDEQNLQQRIARHNTRREFLQKSTLGLGSLALSMMLDPDTLSGAEEEGPTESRESPLKEPHFAPQAKHVIFLHMSGGPSQLELFDYKPKLSELDGEETPESVMKGDQFAFIQGTPQLMGPRAKFERHGDCGAWVSNKLPHFSQIVDDVSFLKAVETDEFNHAPAQLLVQTGSPRPGRPSIGSWATYGLGTPNENLPGFVVMLSGGKPQPNAGENAWGSGFMPSIYEGVQCRSEGEPILYLDNPDGVTRSLRKDQMNALEKINRNAAEKFGDEEILSRIEQYELAHKMQMSVPDVMDISKESPEIRQMYGVNPGKKSFANNCLLARRLVENGVRFVNLFHMGWDHHNSIKGDINKQSRQVDRPMTALIKDLKQRGLFEETLIVWGGEFGRTPMLENRGGDIPNNPGRDHHNSAFTMWMAGGGVKGGYTHGKTDELGYAATEGQVHVHDIQATILNQLGFDHEEFKYRHQGRDFRLTDVHGHVIDEILEKNPNPDMV